jgi:hypothetical protein
MPEEHFLKTIKAATRNHHEFPYVPPDNKDSKFTEDNSFIKDAPHASLNLHLKVNKCLGILQDKSQPAIGGITPLVFDKLLNNTKQNEPNK